MKSGDALDCLAKELILTVSLRSPSIFCNRFCTTAAVVLIRESSLYLFQIDQGVRVQPCQSTPRQTLHSCSEMTEALANGRTPPFHAKRSRAMDPARPRLPHAMSQPIVNTHSGSGCQPCYNTSSSYMALNTHNGASCPTCHTPSGSLYIAGNYLNAHMDPGWDS